MKRNIKISCAAVFSAALISVTALRAQDTVTVRETTVVKTEVTPKLYKGEFGVRYQPSFTYLSVRNSSGDVVEADVSMSNGFGVMFAHNISKMVGLQAEINYDQISQKYKDGGLNRQIRINYLNIPLLLAINTDKTCPVVFGVVVGPQFGLNLGSEFEGDSGGSSDTLQAVLAVKPGDVGLAYGAGFGFALNEERNIRLDLGFRGMYGLMDVNGSTTGDNTYNVLVKGSRKSYGGYLGLTVLF